MKNQWLVWTFILGVIAVVIIAFNSEHQQAYRPDVPAEVQYEDTVVIAEEPMGVIPPSSSPELSVEDVEKTASAPEPEIKSVVEDFSEYSVKQAAEPYIQKTTDAETIKAAAASPAEISSKASSDIAPADVDLNQVAYTIQVASVKEFKDAQRALAGAVAKKHPGFVAKRDLGDKGVWYRVYIGQFDNKQEADSYLQQVRKDYASAFVIAPSKKR